jgi:hypothetical protein
MEVGVNSMPRSDEDIHTTLHRHFCIRALLDLGEEKVVPQIEVERNPPIHRVTNTAMCKIPEGVK